MITDTLTFIGLTCVIGLVVFGVVGICAVVEEWNIKRPLRESRQAMREVDDVFSNATARMMRVVEEKK